MVMLFKHYWQICKQEKNFKNIAISVSLLILSLFYTVFSNKILLNKEILSAILSVIAILTGFFFNALVLLMTLRDVGFLKKLKNMKYPEEKKPFLIGKTEVILTYFDYLLISLFFLILLGFLSSLLIVLGMTILPQSQDNFDMQQISIHTNIYVSILVFLIFYFFIEAFTLLSKLYIIFFRDAKEKINPP